MTMVYNGRVDEDRICLRVRAIVAKVANRERKKANDQRCVVKSGCPAVEMTASEYQKSIQGRTAK